MMALAEPDGKFIAGTLQAPGKLYHTWILESCHAELAYVRPNIINYDRLSSLSGSAANVLSLK